MEEGGAGRTPCLVTGSSRGLVAWNSPWLTVDSALRDAMVVRALGEIEGEDDAQEVAVWSGFGNTGEIEGEIECVCAVDVKEVVTLGAARQSS